MTWIKICGITNLEDAQASVEAGADALGFVFYEKSPRNIDRQLAGKIAALLPEGVEKVGVFVNESVERIDQYVQHAGLTAVQLCGKESVVAFIKHLRSQRDKDHRPKVISVIPSGTLPDHGLFIDDDLRTALHALLIDSASDAEPGGTGKRFDWEKSKKEFEMLGLTIPTIIAGGLTPKNVVEALSLLHPWGVDVASGVEAKPGKKDPEKVRAFINAVREAERLV
jgi:phosphoribosylanthranilate isomerase